MEFIDTLDSCKFGDYTIVRQEYLDENEKTIYNVSIECDFDNGLLTKTLDIFESESDEESAKFYEFIVARTEKANKLS